MLPARTPLDRINLRVIQAQIEPTHELPEGARTMLVINQLLHINGAQKQLLAINGNQSRRRRRRRDLHTRSVRPFPNFAIS